MRDTSRLGGLITRGVVVAALTAGGIALATAPTTAASVQADSAGISGYGAGTVGVTQNISYSTGGDPSSCAPYTLTATYSSPSQTYSTDGQVVGNAVLFNWAPAVAGTVSNLTITSGNACSPASAVNVPFSISKVATTTTISAPNTTTVGTPTTITVYVQSQSPSAYAPTGTVTVTNANGAKITTMGLTASGLGQAYAYWRFTPPTAGNYYFTASYSGDANANAGSPSAQDVMIATPSGGTISLAAPSTMTQGVPVTLVATVAPAGVQGSVGFTLNGAPISGAIAIGANSQASFLWTPNVVGQVTLGASYTTNQGGSGSTTDKVTIVAGPTQKDVITLVQPGWGPWSPNGTYTLGNGSNFAFQASTLSGAAVTLSESGPCAVSGLTINVPTGSGQCNLVATSPGGNGYAGVQYGYTVSLIPGNQTANIAAPLSGRLQKGRSYVLESPGQQDTNAGQNITWKVTKGKNVCKLGFPNDGSVTLKVVKKGQCNVKGSAPGVPGQWNAYTVVRSYRA